MQVIYKAPHKAPEVIYIPNTLEALQRAVGGHIETSTLCTDVVIISNEEARLGDYDFNVIICEAEFFGSILVVGAQGDKFTSLKKPKEVAALLFGKEG